jgi:hypothetical protein
MQHAGTRQQFDKGEGFHQIIVRALFETFDAVVHRIAGAEDEHRRDEFAVFDFLQHLQAVHVGEAQVEDDEVVFGGVHAVDGVVAVVDDIYRVAGALQTASEKIGNSLFIFDNE